MRFAVIADVHGNLPALKAVLADAQKHGAERYIFVGDYCLSNPYPDQCVSLIQSVNEKYVVKGNEEAGLQKLSYSDMDNWNDGQMEISYLTYRSLSEENRRWLFSLPDRLTVEFADKSLHISHKLSRYMKDDDIEVIWSELPAFEYKSAGISFKKQQIMIKSALDENRDFQERFAALPDGAYIFAHSHIQWSYRSEDCKKLLLNPGSCGLPLDAVTEGTPYALLDVADDGFSAKEMRAQFDSEAYLETFKQSSHYKKAMVWSRIIEMELSKKCEHKMFFLRFMEKYADSIGDKKRPFSVDTWEKGFEEWIKDPIFYK